MRIGYPCINRTLPCSGSNTLRLRSYTDQRLLDIMAQNLDCLLKVLQFNVQHGLLFFRITSDLVPFDSHPVNQLDWASKFAAEFEEIGLFIRRNGIRISMHPDQFVVLNTPVPRVLNNSLAELRYHSRVMDLMNLDADAKIQLHVGGIYQDKSGSLERFIRRFEVLEENLIRRLVIENDDRLYNLQDCLHLHRRIGVPVLFDSFHHELFNEGETLTEALDLAASTWGQDDGLPMVDYSRQNGSRRGSHAESLDAETFRSFLQASRPYDFDLMLEIKDKEKSALQALAAAGNDPRLKKGFKSGLLKGSAIG
jgi:UV DNA damage endonuclease